MPNTTATTAQPASTTFTVNLVDYTSLGKDISFAAITVALVIWLSRKSANKLIAKQIELIEEFKAFKASKEAKEVEKVEEKKEEIVDEVK
jgi:hypothetical protein